jgi:hypothetical protein
LKPSICDEHAGTDQDDPIDAHALDCCGVALLHLMMKLAQKPPATRIAAAEEPEVRAHQQNTARADAGQPMNQAALPPPSISEPMAGVSQSHTPSSSAST